MQTYIVGGAVRDELLGRPNADRDYVVVGATPEAMLAQGCNPLLLPTQILQLDHLPKLGSGKTDFGLARQVALQARIQDPEE